MCGGNGAPLRFVDFDGDTASGGVSMKSLFAVEPGSETAFEQLPDSLPAPFERIELPGELLDVAFACDP